MHNSRQDLASQNLHTGNLIVRQLLEEWRIYCDAHSKMHNEALGYFKFLNRVIMIASIIMSAVSSAMSLTIVSNNKECSNDSMTTMLIILNSIAMGATALITIHRFLNLDELQHLHDLYSDMHVCLAKDVQMHLVLQTSTTPVFFSMEEMAKHIKSRLDILIDKSPAIPGFIVNKVVLGTRELYSHSIQNLQGVDSIQAII